MPEQKVPTESQSMSAAAPLLTGEEAREDLDAAIGVLIRSINYGTLTDASNALAVLNRKVDAFRDAILREVTS